MHQNYKEGWIEVICGCMFAGKTETLISIVSKLKYTRKKMLIFKPSIDNRYSDDSVASHAGKKVKSIQIKNSKEILDYVKEDTDVVIIDEAQFLDENLADICDDLANRGLRVIVAGLDMDFRGLPFGVMPQLIVRAEFVTKLTAICSVCGAPATRTQRLINGKPAHFNDPIILVGSKDEYEARCRHCHLVRK